MMAPLVQHCDRCGRVFNEGQTRYLVTINLVADFDGTIRAPSTPKETSEMLREIKRKTEEELLSEVYQQLSFTICKPCRDAWVASPLAEGPADDVSPAGHVH